MHPIRLKRIQMLAATGEVGDPEEMLPIRRADAAAALVASPLLLKKLIEFDDAFASLRLTPRKLTQRRPRVPSSTRTSMES